jgi:hypothetical protein
MTEGNMVEETISIEEIMTYSTETTGIIIDTTETGTIIGTTIIEIDTTTIDETMTGIVVITEKVINL